MPTPIKVRWQKNGLQRFKDWIEAELQNTIGDRAPLESKWVDLMVQWRASLPTEEATHPWPGAMNIEFPLTAIHSDPVYSDFMQALHTPEDYWTPIAKRSDRTEHANPLREFMTALDQNVLKLRAVNERAILDQVVLGTAIYKNHTSLRRRPSIRMVGDTLEKTTVQAIVPKIEHVPLQHFYIPANAWNIDPDAPIGAAAWVAQKFYLVESALRSRDYDKEAVERVSKWIVDNNRDPVDEAVRASDSYEPWRMERAELFEVWARFDTDGDGVDEDVMVVLHLPSMEILRADYSESILAHGKRPFHNTVYLPSFGFYGLGIAELDEWAQSTLSLLFNHLGNNVVLVNSRMYGAPQGSSLLPGEPIWPGRVVTLPPGEKITEIRLGEVYPSLQALIQFVMQIAEMRTAVSELRQGNLTGLPGRTPATTVLSVLREGSKRFDMILSHIRDRHSDIGLRMLQNVAQLYKDYPELWQSVCIDYLGPEDAAKVMEIFDDDVNALEDSFGIRVSATSALVNKETEKQAFVGMMQTIIPMYQQLVQTAGLLMQVPPGTPMYETAAASYKAGVQLITRMLEKFDVQNPSEYVGNLAALADQISPPQEAQAGAMGAPAPFGNFPPGPPTGIDPSAIFGL